MKQAWKGMTALLLVLLLLGACAAPSAEPEPSPAPEPSAVSTPSETPEPSAVPSKEPLPELSDAERKDTLALWLTEDCPLCEGLTALAEQYAAEQPLSLRLFPDEQSLREALSGAKPDLVLCSARTAAALLEAGELGALTPCETTELFRFAPGCTEGSYFPLGAEAPVLVAREEQRAELERCHTWEALAEEATMYGRRWMRPCLSADSFARLFACAMEQKGSPFYAMREQDLESEDYRYYYNLLAEAAFSGGLVAPEEAVLPAVAEGRLVCGVCSSTALAQADLSGLAVLPLPPLNDCENLIDAQVYGLAVRKSADAARVQAFLDWLGESGRAAQTALSAGLLPAEPRQGDALSAGLTQAAQSYRLFLPEENAGYRLHGEEFEQSFRRALALLG